MMEVTAARLRDCRLGANAFPARGFQAAEAFSRPQAAAPVLLAADQRDGPQHEGVPSFAPQEFTQPPPGEVGVEAEEGQLPRAAACPLPSLRLGPFRSAAPAAAACAFWLR